MVRCAVREPVGGLAVCRPINPRRCAVGRRVKRRVRRGVKAPRRRRSERAISAPRPKRPRALKQIVRLNMVRPKTGEPPPHTALRRRPRRPLLYPSDFWLIRFLLYRSKLRFWDVQNAVRPTVGLAAWL